MRDLTQAIADDGDQTDLLGRDADIGRRRDGVDGGELLSALAHDGDDIHV